jgi:DHA1 family multidrug resistance protein-like MFS transporter
MVILFLAANCISQGSYILIAPFVPPVLAEKGVSTQTIGLIFAAYPIAVILTSPFIGNYIEKTGPALFLMAALFLYGIAFGLFGCIEHMENVTLIIVTSVISRMFQGVCSACIQTTSYSIMATYYPDQISRLLGLLEVMVGIAFIISPLASA